MSYIKLFFNVLKAHKLNLIIPFAIVIIFTTIMVKSSSTTVSDYEPNAYIVDKDNTDLSRELVEELKKNVDYKEYTGKEDLENEFMQSYVSLYIEIPEGFYKTYQEYTENGKKFSSSNKIIVKGIENSRSKIFIEEKINNFLNTKASQKNISTYQATSILEMSQENNEKKSPIIPNGELIKVETVSAVNADDSSMKIWAISFGGYGIIYSISTIIGTFIMLIRKKNLKDRYSCGPISTKQYLFQIVLSSGILMLVICLAFALYIMNVLYNGQINGIWFVNIFNMLIMGIFSLGLGLIYGTVAKNIDALSGISVGVSMALSFLGGLFVPLEIFSNTMKTIAKFTPTYWYSMVSEELNNGANNINFGNVAIDFGMELAFIAIIFVILVVLNKKPKFGAK